MTGRKRKGVWPAVTEVERVAGARLRLYELYDRDDDLANALMRLHGDWWGELGPGLRRLDECLPDLGDPAALLSNLVNPRRGRDYLSDLVALAAEVGLDRIPMVGTPPVVIVGYLPSGLAQLHRFLWRLDKALLWERAPAGTVRLAEPMRRPTFVALASFGTPIPAVDSSIAGADVRWDPRSELLASARHRLLAETDLNSEAIENELARIADEGGYEFPDTSTQRNGIWRLDRDTWWVWWRIRFGWTYPAIAQEWMRLHPGDLRLQERDGDVDRKDSLESPREPWLVIIPTDAVGLIRKAVTTFARRARVNVQTGPGRRGDSRRA